MQTRVLDRQLEVCTCKEDGLFVSEEPYNYSGVDKEPGGKGVGGKRRTDRENDGGGLGPSGRGEEVEGEECRK